MPSPPIRRATPRSTAATAPGRSPRATPRRPSPTVAEAWHIEGGKLYLNYSKSVQRQWSEDIPGNIGKADTNWPGLKASN